MVPPQVQNLSDSERCSSSYSLQDHHTGGSASRSVGRTGLSSTLGRSCLCVPPAELTSNRDATVQQSPRVPIGSLTPSAASH